MTDPKELLCENISYIRINSFLASDNFHVININVDFWNEHYDYYLKTEFDIPDDFLTGENLPYMDYDDESDSLEITEIFYGEDYEGADLQEWIFWLYKHSGMNLYQIADFIETTFSSQ